MTADMEFFEKAVRAAIESGDKDRIENVIQLCVEAEEAKQHLRFKGYGVTGTGILATAKEVPDLDIGL